ncbi:Hsp20/alpha crystallin family protein [Flavobacterium glaciei]|uniref:Hsp20/alpha crystallin family protein n=1 Tax=Flavobacterium glaciei TaxID=386300 RepID=UPI000E0B567F
MFKQKDFQDKLSAASNELFLWNKKKEQVRKKGNYIRKNINHQSFFRSFILTESIEVNKIEVNFKNEILQIDIEKKTFFFRKIIQIRKTFKSLTDKENAFILVFRNQNCNDTKQFKRIKWFYNDIIYSS